MNWFPSYLKVPFPWPSWEHDTPEKHVLKRLQSSLKTIEEIRDLCRVPSISFGVLHEGRVIFAESVGFRDSVSKGRPNWQSLYTLCSVSKTFVSVAFGLLVDEGKISWADKVSKYLPEFEPKGDEPTFNDLFRHSGGLDNPVVSLLGPDGKVLVPQEKFISLLNDTPTEYKGKPLFGTWAYSNVSYSLIVLVIEKVSGYNFSQLLQERVIDPLGMKHTAVTKSQLAKNSNIAYPHARLEDGSWKRLDHEWTDEKNTPVLGMIGIRSSVRDMLIYSAAIMDAYLSRSTNYETCDSQTRLGENSRKSFEPLSNVEKNPIKQIGAILDDYYWTRPHNDPFDHEIRYHLGWLKVPMPSCMVSWGSWNKTLADEASEADQPARDENILGKESGERLLIKATGIGVCGTSSINLLPETRSAIVVFSSGTNCGDAADFAASVLMQELFNLQPKVDVLSMVKREVALRLKDFDNVLKDLEEHRDVSEAEAHPAEYTGEYSGLGITLVVREAVGQDGLELCFRSDCVKSLEYYGKDQYSYWPKSRDEWLEGGWLDWDYYLVGILTFKRDDNSGAVIGATWVWEKGAEPFFFERKG
ncbi:Fc.00g049860.m01.CDS01 [Cosmosporella sp. VM-42]